GQGLFLMWEELGIPPTDDALLIRKAYAARLKVITKSGDRAAFQRLRAAYERATMTAARPPRPAQPRPAEAQPPEPVQPQQPVMAKPLGVITPVAKSEVPERRPLETAHAVAPEMLAEISPPEPITVRRPPDPRAALFSQMRQALAARDYDRAIGLYERGLAQGSLALGTGAAVLGGIMAGRGEDESARRGRLAGAVDTEGGGG